MCVIIYKPKKANIIEKVLRKCWQENPDSGGFMFADNGRLQIVKGFMSFNKFYKKYHQCESQYSDSNFVIHFRVATHGEIDQANCHPFFVNKNIGFVHNGILQCVDVPENSKKSDTRIFSELVLKKFPSDFLARQEYRVCLESIAKTEGSKFAFLTNVGVCHIFNESAGYWHSGCWFSNNSYEDRHMGFFDYGLSARQKSYFMLGEEKWAECLYCGDYLPESELENNICLTCLNETESTYKSWK